jgi:hypothetical protein
VLTASAALSAGLAATAVLAAQDVPPPATSNALFTVLDNGCMWRMVAVPGATHVCLVLALRGGGEADPRGKTGLTNVLALALAFAAERRPEAERWSVKASGAALLLACTAPADAFAARLGDVAAWLRGEPWLDDDVVAVAKARALLACDEALHEYPGPAMTEAVRRRVLAGTPGGRQMVGIAGEIEALTRADLEAWYRACFSPRAAVVVAVGAPPEEGAEAAARDQLAAVPALESPPAPVVHDDAPPVAADRPHPRVLAPFVTAALRAPAVSDPDYLPFLIAMAVVDVRCRRAFGDYRGGEALGRFPFTWFNYRLGEPFVMINRRGVDGHDVDQVRGEVRAVIKRLRSQAVPLGEVRDAVLQVGAQLALPPYPPPALAGMARDPRLLHPHAEVLAMAGVLGWPATLADDLGRVRVDDVQRVLGTWLVDDRLAWFSLVPPAPGR